MVHPDQPDISSQTRYQVELISLPEPSEGVNVNGDADVKYIVPPEEC
jgi:hypothetical protein